MSLRGHLVRGIFGSLGLTIATAGIAFVNGVLLARLLGAASYGIYASAIAVVLLLTVPLTLGFDRLLIRNVAATATTDGWALARGLITRAAQIALPISVAAIVVIGVGAALFSGALAEGAVPVLWLALLMIPLLVLTTLRRAITLGVQRIVSAQLPDALIRPGVFLLFLLAALVTVGSLSASGAMALNLVSVVIAVIAGLVLLWHEAPRELRSSTPTFESRLWVREAIPFALAALAATLMSQIDVVLVGALAGATPAGLYAVAARGAALAIFGAAAVSTTLSPTASQLWTRREIGRLQYVVTRAARGAFLFALAVAVILWLFGPQFLLLFGAEFQAANPTLSLLTLAQVIDCGFGIGGLLLTMTGFQALNFAAVGSAIVVRIAIDIMLIPILGAAGAGVAAVVAVIIVNVMATYFAACRLHLDATPLGISRPPTPDGA
jgi:O-antigen/teichoic acid export membrane protein